MVACPSGISAHRLKLLLRGGRAFGEERDGGVGYIEPLQDLGRHCLPPAHPGPSACILWVGRGDRFWHEDPRGESLVKEGSCSDSAIRPDASKRDDSVGGTEITIPTRHQEGAYPPQERCVGKQNPQQDPGKSTIIHVVTWLPFPSVPRGRPRSWLHRTHGGRCQVTESGPCSASQRSR